MHAISKSFSLNILILFYTEHFLYFFLAAVLNSGNVFVLFNILAQHNIRVTQLMGLIY